MHIRETIHPTFGWCPNAPVIRTAPDILGSLTASVNPLEPDPGAGGTGRFYRGIRLAAGSAKFLVRNKQLLWFSLLTSLVILFMFISVFSLIVSTSYPYKAISYPVFLALVFAVQLIEVFCLYFLLTAIIMSVSSGLSGKPVTVREELSRVKVHTRSILVWSIIMAVVGTALYAILLQYDYDPIMGLSLLLGQFPFDYVLRPETLGPGPIRGDSHIMSAVTFTFFAMIMNFMLFVFTLFVIPAMIFEKKKLIGAVRESFSLAKRSWADILSCFLVFGLVLLAVSLVSLIFHIGYHLVSYGSMFYVFFWYQGGWIAGAALYILMWSIVALIIATLVGISLVGLYIYAKTGTLPAFLAPDRSDPA
jgi:hypothetical protein